MPVFTSSASTTAAVGAAFTFTVSATGNPEPTLTESGALPSGVTFQAGPAGSATISGTAAAGSGGSYPLTLKAASTGGSATQAFTLFIDEASAITSASSATATEGSALSFKVKTTGYPSATVTESGSLPTGVQFAAKANGTATISGTPSAGTGGSYPITLTASNGIGSPSTQDFVLTVNQGAAFTSAAGTTVTVGTTFDFPVTASGSPEPTITETGALPSGVSFEQGPPGSASLTGDPAAQTGGTYAIVLKAKGSGGTVTQSFTLTVDEAPAITSRASATAHRRHRALVQGQDDGVPDADAVRVGIPPDRRELHGNEQWQSDDRRNSGERGDLRHHDRSVERRWLAGEPTLRPHRSPDRTWDGTGPSPAAQAASISDVTSRRTLQPLRH